MPRCNSCGRSNRADARFCDRCGSPLASGSDPVRKVVTVVFGDLVGSTALQERLDPELAAGLMARYYEVMRAAVEQSGGRLEKLVGDGVVAVFGAPIARENDAVRAVRCASVMLEAVATLNRGVPGLASAALRMRVGIHTGEVVFSAGAELVGDTLNTAARLEQAAAPNEVLISESTWQLARRHVTAEAAPTPQLRGKAAAVRVWRVLSPEPDVARASIGELRTSMIGRDDALSRLISTLDAVEAGDGGRVVTVIGSPGVGKTRLVREFVELVGDRAMVVSGRCGGDGESVGCQSLTEVLQRVVRANDVRVEENQRTARGPARSATAALGSTWQDANPVGLAERLNRSEPARPVLVVLDELHAAPRPMLVEIARFAAEIEALPIMLLVAARPRLRELCAQLTQPEGAGHDVIDLQPLDAVAARQLLAQLLGARPSPCTLRERVVECSEGNPLFLIESVRMLIDEGYLVREGGEWLCVLDPAHVPVPPTIHQLVGARLERLEPQERFLLERAAVIGRQFGREALEYLAGPPLASSIRGCLTSLRRRELIEPAVGADVEAYRFCAELTRDIAYGRLLMQTRVELHESYAAWLGDRWSMPVGAQAESIDWHTARAQEYRRLLASV